jgi:hypothetical protein
MGMLSNGVLDLLRLTVGGLEAQPTCVPYGCCLQEVEGLAKAGVVFYGINLSVGLSVAIPGFASDMAHGLLGGFCGEFVPVGFCAWGLL